MVRVCESNIITVWEMSFEEFQNGGHNKEQELSYKEQGISNKE